jgi:hypothetical protein
MDTKHKILYDFATLFNAFWYRDFPLTQGYKTIGSRADWTIHIGICVRSCADLLGFFTYFESGGRTDAIIRNNQEEDLAHIEWEWWEASSYKVNEIQKLSKHNKEPVFSVFISYSEDKLLEQNLQRIIDQWQDCTHSLLVFLVVFNKQGRYRMFNTLDTYLIDNGKWSLLRTQPALPWDVVGTRWESNKKALASKLLENPTFD